MPGRVETTPTGGDGHPVIALEEVTKDFGPVRAVDRVCLAVGRGEFFSLLGPSGCGKTTLLRMLAGFEEVTSGRIRLDGVDVSGVPPYRRNINTVFQQYALFPHLSVFDNVAFGPRLQGASDAEVRRRVEAMLAVVHLDGYGPRRPDQLSGGQRQRVALARALVNQPSALLLDEPLSALDRKLRQAMQIELKRIQREVGITFLCVTHDQEEALTMSDRIAVMRAGHVEQVGTPEAMYDAPATAFVAGFIGGANLLRARVERWDGAHATVCLDAGGRCAVATNEPFAPQATAVVMIRPERVRLSHEPPTGDDCGVRATLRGIDFLGPVLRCGLVDAAGDTIVAHVAAAMRPPGLAPGAELWVSWEQRAARLLPPPDAAVREMLESTARADPWDV